MKYDKKTPAILLLADGTVFHGHAAGKLKGTATGEICFNTGMSGYQEIFTDPSYFGQLMVTTHVHIGNYGIHKEEVESESIKISGLICKSFNTMFSREEAETDIATYFEKNKIIAIDGIDTRAVVRHVRDKGAMNAIISSEILDVEELKKVLAKVPSMEGLELSSKVSTKKSWYMGNSLAPLKVAVLDVGVKKNIVRCLVERNCYAQVFPMNTTLTEMLKWEPDGFLISNGPGDPSVMTGVIEELKKIINCGKPVFGICLGHQLIAEANGIRTYKMHNGHRGINHPVKNLITGKSEITSQNHGFSVKAEDVKKIKNVEVTHINLNDDTIEGMRMTDRNVFTVQHHPEASPGPHDSRYLFDQFIEMMNSVKEKSGKTKTVA